MKIAIHHETNYRYSQQVSYAIQMLRLTPRPDGNQRVLDWAIDTPGRRTRHVDAYGNVTHALVLDSPHEQLRIAARGTVEITPLSNGALSAYPSRHDSQLPREMYLVPTPLTAIDSSVRAFADESVPRGLRTPQDALFLARAIVERVSYQRGVTHVMSPASHALETGRGVCQDHTHLLLAVCRAVGVPARYVSGYVHPGNSEHSASHAWADLWFDETGWVSIDVTHAQFPTEFHCRVAIGRDYESASPVRGVRTGGGEEQLDVHVTIGVGESNLPPTDHSAWPSPDQ